MTAGAWLAAIGVLVVIAVIAYIVASRLDSDL